MGDTGTVEKPYTRIFRRGPREQEAGWKAAPAKRAGSEVCREAVCAPATSRVLSGYLRAGDCNQPRSVLEWTRFAPENPGAAGPAPLTAIPREIHNCGRRVYEPLEKHEPRDALRMRARAWRTGNQFFNSLPHLRKLREGNTAPATRICGPRPVPVRKNLPVTWKMNGIPAISPAMETPGALPRIDASFSRIWAMWTLDSCAGLDHHVPARDDLSSACPDTERHAAHRDQ
jgi:hypothetical protein